MNLVPAGVAPLDHVRNLVRMANRIGLFCASQPGDPAAGVAEHLRRHWPAVMRAALIAYENEGGAALDPIPRQAVRALVVACLREDTTPVELYQGTMQPPGPGSCQINPGCSRGLFQ